MHCSIQYSLSAIKRVHSGFLNMIPVDFHFLPSMPPVPKVSPSSAALVSFSARSLHLFAGNNG